jgi:SRSO17 transposase
MIIQLPDYNPNIMDRANITVDKQDQFNEDFNNYMLQYATCFQRRSQFGHFQLYARGLMGDTERKSIEPMVLKLGGEKLVRSVQQFMTRSTWNTGKVSEAYQNILLKNKPSKIVMIMVDSTDFKKKGEHSVAVADQYRGSDGKVDRCQVAVFAAVAGNNFYGLMDYRLYIPQMWFEEDHKELMKECQVPGEREFKTKNELAIEMIESVNKINNFDAEVVGGDAVFGHDSKFRESIPAGLYYFLDIHSSDKFYIKPPKFTVPERCGRGRTPSKFVTKDISKTVAQIINNEKIPWRETCFGIGSKGPIMGKEKLVEIFEVKNETDVERLWLYARKHSDGKIRYAISNAPKETPPEKFTELSIMRWPIEQCFEECKSDLGLDHFEGRSFQGWHRHVLIVLVVHLFLQLMRNKYSVDVEDLSQKGKVLLKGINLNNKKEVSILTLGNMRLLIYFSFFDHATFAKQVSEVRYRLKNYAKSFLSYCKKKLKKIPTFFKEIFGIEFKKFCSL